MSARLATLTVLLACSAAPARAAPTEPEPVFPAGPVVRGARPFAVRVAGAARVRAEGAPWALPARDGTDEFLVQAPRADLTLRVLEIDTGDDVRRVAVDPLRFEPSARVVAAFVPPPGSSVLRLPTGGLPTLREAWLVYDDVEGTPDTLGVAERRALDDWRSGPRPGDGSLGARGAFEPHGWAPGAEVFRATAATAARTARLPRDVAIVLAIVAASQVLLLVLAARRRPAVRALWIAAPAAAFLGWAVAGGRLPGSVRVTTFCVTATQDAASGAAGGADRFVVARFDAPGGGEVAFRVAPGAGHPALARYDATDGSDAGTEIGRDVRLAIPPGQSRVLAWRLPPGVPEVAPPDAAEAPPAQVAAWLRTLGLEPAGAAGPGAGDVFERRRGFREVEAPGVLVSARK